MLVKVLDKPYLALTSTMGQGILACAGWQEGRQGTRCSVRPQTEADPSINRRRVARAWRMAGPQGQSLETSTAITPSLRGCARPKSQDHAAPTHFLRFDVGRKDRARTHTQRARHLSASGVKR
jgi:hypothetical protein